MDIPRQRFMQFTAEVLTMFKSKGDFNVSRSDAFGNLYFNTPYVSITLRLELNDKDEPCPTLDLSRSSTLNGIQDIGKARQSLQQIEEVVNRLETLILAWKAQQGTK